jgi:hypothetical protein
MNRHDFRQLQLAGTITFPATFPQLGSITLRCESIPTKRKDSEKQSVLFLNVREFPSARVTLMRRVMADRVRAVFLPRDPNRVSFEDGTWLLGSEVADRLQKNNCPVLGIVYVGESEPTLLQVSAGMTAAESAQYYPPLPCDRSHNHYACTPKGTSWMPSCGVDHADANGRFREETFTPSCDELCPSVSLEAFPRALEMSSCEEEAPPTV